MTNNKYIIKSLAPWMIDELIVLSRITSYELIFLRDQDDFYKQDIKKLKNNGVEVTIKPFTTKHLFKKLIIVIGFVFSNLFKFKFDYNFVIGLKSIAWFLRIDVERFSQHASIHAQFATQAALISYLIKKYYNDSPSLSFTFHAHDIYFKNKWFNLLVDNSVVAFSISEYNIKYVKEKFTASDKISLSRLGVFREHYFNNKEIDKANEAVLKLGLISWFVEKKGIKYLLEAMLSLKEQGEEKVHLTLAGDGPLKPEITSFIAKNNLKQQISYIGKIKGEEKQAFFKNIDVFILPSITLNNDKDGIPVVLMEAISASLPLISTNVSGIPEICINDFNGKLIKEKSVDEIVNAILFLKKDKVKAKEYAANSLKLSEQYDIILNTKQKAKTIHWQPN